MGVGGALFRADEGKRGPHQRPSLSRLRWPLTRPGIFEYSQGGGRLAAALDASFNLITASNPARRGAIYFDLLQRPGAGGYAAGIGRAGAAGHAGAHDGTPAVTIGGRPAAVTFSGLAPGFAGLYQVNVTVPADAPAGNQPLELSIGGEAAQASSIPVQ